MATNSETADSWSQTITLTLISTSQVTYDDLELDVSCTVQMTCAIASVDDDVSPIHRLSLAPSTPIKLYRVTLRALQEEVPTEGPDPWADAIIDRGSDRGSSPMSEGDDLIDSDTHSFTIWSGSVSCTSGRATLSNSSWSQTQAAILGNATSVTSGANFKVSGFDDIKGKDDSYMLPRTQALNMSPIKIENRSNGEILDVFICAMPERFISLGGTEPVKIVRTFKVLCPPQASTPS
ncbi:hypothetical protein FOC4_g10010009 [Fusarium odoratissimum]|uniref:Uncharacterized protein n=1 Tax=Fusarium oxysporum f. sp. cubense (strain race 4) TaxID=2502994 RepID=N1S9L5_FUSC4|nr:hypothetical protein FOC4_g10010009 [Fusarium odoratissimum]